MLKKLTQYAVVLEILMDIFKAYELMQGIVFPRDNLLELTRLEQEIEGDDSGIIPKYLLEQEYIDHIESDYEQMRLLGVPIGNSTFIHALMLWGRDKAVFELPMEVGKHVLDTDPNNQLESNLFHKMPKQAFFIDQKFDQYSGILVCYDYYLSVADEKISTLELFLLDAENKSGNSIQLILPDINRVIDWSEHKKKAYWPHIKKAINLLIFVLTESSTAVETAYANRSLFTIGTQYVKDLINIDENQTYYRKAHWHKYWIKNDSGVREGVYKWIAPTLVSKPR